MGWNPWQHAADHHPDIDITCDEELPARIWGLTYGQRIWLCRTLNQARRRCTLTHELIHIERGIIPTDARGQAREEKAVTVEAARRLIVIDALVDALRETRDPHLLADALWVDMPTLRARMASLDPVETAQLENDLDGEWLWIP
jgi:hypothetical protein